MKLKISCRMKTGKYTYLKIEQYILKQPVSQRTKQMNNNADVLFSNYHPWQPREPDSQS